MVNKIMYQKIQYFKRKGFTKADIIRETGLNKRTVFKYLGGRPKELVIDQDNVVVSSENRGDIIYTRDFKQFIEEIIKLIRNVYVNLVTSSCIFTAIIIHISLYNLLLYLHLAACILLLFSRNCSLRLYALRCTLVCIFISAKITPETKQPTR